MESKGKGYIGNSMSVNAHEAYADGQMPKSKWSKKAIINAAELIDDIKVSEIGLDRLTLVELRSHLLKAESWHHTGKFYRATDFYAFDEESFESMSKERVDAIIAARKKEQRATDAKKLSAADDKAALEAARLIYRKLEIMLKSGAVPYKTVGGLVKAWIAGKVGEAQYISALDILAKDYELKIAAWERLPRGHYRLGYVKRYRNNPEAELINEYSTKASNNKHIQMLKEWVKNNQ